MKEKGQKKQLSNLGKLSTREVSSSFYIQECPYLFFPFVNVMLNMLCFHLIYNWEGFLFSRSGLIMLRLFVSKGESLKNFMKGTLNILKFAFSY